jgi:hypothetical protein
MFIFLPAICLLCIEYVRERLFICCYENDLIILFQQDLYSAAGYCLYLPVVLFDGQDFPCRICLCLLKIVKSRVKMLLCMKLHVE